MKGYTIVEVMVVIGVIGLLSVISLVGIRGAREREELIAASRQLVGDLISVQNRASSGKNRAGFEVVQDGDDGYKINAYKYNYDSCLNGDEILCAGDYCDDCPSGETSCTYCKEEVSGVSFSSPQVRISSPGPFQVYFFRPPNMGRALLSSDPDPLEITLERTGLGFEKKIIISGGDTVQIYEE